MIKKALLYTILIAIVAGIVPLPFGGVNVAHAAWVNPWTYWKDKGVAVVDSIKSWAGDAIIQGFATIGELCIWLASKVLWLAANLFNYSIDLSIGNATYSNLSALNVGWEMCRNLANLFFVFILLYIAIATILQLSGLGAKQLLVKVIVIALLVNFSLVITRVVIDASNVFATEFNDLINTIPGMIDPNTGLPDRNMGISGIVVASVGVTGIFDINGYQQFGGVRHSGQSLQEVIIGTVFGTIFILVLAFVFAAAAYMMMMRMVVLIFLMLLSPLAFLAMILPKTGQYATMWWDKLFKQAFFAPIMLFLLYVVLIIMTSGQVSGVISTTTGTDPAIPFASTFSGNNTNSVGVVLNYIVMIGLTVSALFVSKQMGVAGSEAAMAVGTKMAKGARGYATGVGKRGVARTALRPLAESAGAQKIAARIPLIGKPLMRGVEAGAKAGGLDKLEEKKAASAGAVVAKLPMAERAKYIRSQGVRTQRALIEKMKPEERAEMLKTSPELASTFAHYGVTRKAGEGVGSVMKKLGLEKAGKAVEKKSQEKVSERMMAGLPEKEKKLTEKAGKELARKETVKGILKPEKDVLKQEAVQLRFEKDIASIRPKDMSEILTEGGEKADQLYSRLAEINKGGGTLEELSDKIAELGNPQVAAYISSNPGAQAFLKRKGIIVPEKGDKKAGAKKEPLIKIAGKHEDLGKYRS